MKQLAWLHAPIDPLKDAKGRSIGAARPRRMESYQGIGDYPLPDIDDGMHIIDALMEVGPLTNTGMGISCVSWQEIQAWSAATHSALAPHELQLLRSLSVDYLQSYENARKADCPSPMLMQPKTAAAAQDLKAKIKSVLRG